MNIILILSTFLFVSFTIMAFMPSIERVYIKYIHFLKNMCSLCGNKMNISSLIYLQLVLGGSFGSYFIVSQPPMTAIPMGIIGWSLPLCLVKVAIARRRSRFQKQLQDSLTLISSSLKAGFSVLQSIELVSVEVDDPIGFEFRRLISKVRFGHTIDEALEDLEYRMGGEDLTVIRSAISIQLEMGGDLAEILENIGGSIRDREKASGQLKTATSQGKLTGMVVGLIPVGLYFILSVIQPGYFDPLFNTVIGRMLLASAFILEFIGIFMIYKICKVEV